MSFNLVSKLNNLIAEQEELRSQVVYITALAPPQLNNLNSIAGSINNDANVYQSLTNSIALKANQATTYTKI
jgi:hypothetical protein